MSKLALISAAIVGILVIIALLFLLGPNVPSHRVTSPGGQVVLAKVSDEGWSWDWGADFYVDLYIIGSNGQECIWRGGGEGSKEDAIYFQQSIRWIDEKEIHFSSQLEDSDYVLRQGKFRHWWRTATPWDPR